MSAAPAPVRPVAGPTFRAIAAQRIEGGKRKKLLALIAAYQDAGQATCSAPELAERLGWKPIQVQGLLSRLEADGLVECATKRKGKWPRFRVVLDGDARGGRR
jgi:DNA-binding MarR family transcriptional regulator